MSTLLIFYLEKILTLGQTKVFITKSDCHCQYKINVATSTKEELRKVKKQELPHLTTKRVKQGSAIQQPGHLNNM